VKKQSAAAISTPLGVMAAVRDNAVGVAAVADLELAAVDSPGDGWRWVLCHGRAPGQAASTR
jgi:hypothetical protein